MDQTKLNYTDQAYWEEYYDSSSEDAQIIHKVVGKYDDLWDLAYNSAFSQPKTLLEIGAFPGRYLAYLSSKYSLEATGLDFNSDTDKFYRTVKSLNVKNVEYVQKDFFEYYPSNTFDWVISLGFVEHFENYPQVLDKHAEWCNPGGVIVVFIPNKRYLRALYGNLLDSANQNAHNLNCMNLETFTQFAQRNSLKIIHLRYRGGFGYKVHAPLKLWQKPFYAIVRRLSIFFQPWMIKNPSKWWSGSIVAIFQKPLGVK
jgi:cyclopropane fatty-acyl-phospholipid synthase-like methyltransferase